MKWLTRQLTKNITGITDTKKVDLGRLYYLYTITLCFLFFSLSFFLLELSELSNYQIRLPSKLMPVNLSQYMVVVGAFNSRFIYTKQQNIFKNAFRNSKVKQTIAKEIFTVFTSFLISSSWSFINLLRIKARFIILSVFRISYICILLTLTHHIWLYLIIFNRSGDTEKNPGLKANSYQSFYWNLNSISAHNFLKLSLLRAYITVHKFDVICISETYLDSSILHDDDNLQIPDYNLYREDHSLNVKRGGVCIYYIISLPLKIKNIHY